MEKETKKPTKGKTAEKKTETKKTCSKKIIGIIIAAVVAIAAIVVVIIAICFSSKASALVGKWYANGNHNYYFYQFNEDGTGLYGYGDYEEGMKFTYTDNSDSVIIKYDGKDNELDFKYKIEEDTLTIEDSIGQEVIYKK